MNWPDIGRLFEGLGLVIGGLGHVSTVLRARWQPWIVLATFARFVMAASLGVALVLALVSLDWLVAIVAVAIWLARAALWISKPARSQIGAELTVLTANLLIGAADPDALVRLVVEYRVDVLFVQELTPQASQSIQDAGIGAELAYDFIEARDGGGGTAMWSRFPLAEQTSHDGFCFAVLSARLQLPGGSPFVCAGHISPPWPYPSAVWARELGLLGRLLDGRARPGGVSDAVVLGADLNATFDHPHFRALLRGELRDAGAQLGRRRMRTWPADRLWPVFGIDHILLGSATAREVRTVDLPGSDHRGVLAKVKLPQA